MVGNCFYIIIQPELTCRRKRRKRFPSTCFPAGCRRSDRWLASAGLSLQGQPSRTDASPLRKKKGGSNPARASHASISNPETVKMHCRVSWEQTGPFSIISGAAAETRGSPLLLSVCHVHVLLSNRFSKCECVLAGPHNTTKLRHGLKVTVRTEVKSWLGLVLVIRS